MSTILSLDYERAARGLSSQAKPRELPPLEPDLTGFEALAEHIRKQLPNAQADAGDGATHA